MNSPWYFNRNILLVFAVLFCVLSLYVSLHHVNKELFSSSGAVVTVAGLFLNIKHTMVFHLEVPLINKYYIKSGARFMGSARLTEEERVKIKNFLSDEKYGVAFMLIGTVIWAYGAHLVEALKI